MKNYEWYNEFEKKNESLEVQAMGLVLDDMNEIYGRSYNVDLHKEDFQRYLMHLNEDTDD